MKPTTFCLIVSLAVAVLVIAILCQGPKKKQKEGFQSNGIQMGIGMAVLVLLVLFAGFFLFYWNVPNQPPNFARKISYFNLN